MWNWLKQLFGQGGPSLPTISRQYVIHRLQDVKHVRIVFADGKRVVLPMNESAANDFVSGFLGRWRSEIEQGYTIVKTHMKLPHFSVSFEFGMSEVVDVGIEWEKANAETS